MSAIESYSQMKKKVYNIEQFEKTYIVAYDFNNFDDTQSTNLRNYLTKINGTQILESTWIIKTRLSISKVTDNLLIENRFDSDDQFIVVQITDYVLGNNLMNDVSKYFK